MCKHWVKLANQQLQLAKMAKISADDEYFSIVGQAKMNCRMNISLFDDIDYCEWGATPFGIGGYVSKLYFHFMTM